MDPPDPPGLHGRDVPPGPPGPQGLQGVPGSPGPVASGILSTSRVDPNMTHKHSRPRKCVSSIMPDYASSAKCTTITPILTCRNNFSMAMIHKVLK